MIKDANGDDAKTPNDYPDPDKRKNSLLVRIGGERYQGGVEQSFVASEPGILALQPNDGNPGDNTRGWLVSVTISAPGGSEKETPFEKDPDEFEPKSVSNRVVDWHTDVPAGARVSTLADGEVDFGSPWPFQVFARADGTEAFAPKNYPVPPLRQNSLVCRVGYWWYQGGIDATFVTLAPGNLTCQPNDATLDNNSRKWNVSIIVTPPNEPLDTE